MIKNEYILNFISKGVRKTKDSVNKLDKSEKKLIATNKALSISFSKVKQAMTAISVVVTAMGGYAVKTASQFETLKTRLNTLYGSVNKGTKAFNAFNTVAATTPFALASVVEAGAQLKAFGVDAEKNIKGVADLAAFIGVDVVEAAQAMGRAFAGGAGAADVLRDRGVLQLIKSFKGIDDLTKLTLPEFRTALEEAMIDPSLGIAGATDALSETFSGAYSNMWDSVDRLAAKMGDELLPIAKDVVKWIGNWASEMAGSQSPLEEQINSIHSQQMKMGFLVRNLREATVGSENYEMAVSRINREYPELLSNIDTENINMEDLFVNLQNIRKERSAEIKVILQKIKIKALEDKLTEVYTRQHQAIVDATQATSVLYTQLKTKAEEYYESAEVPEIVKNSLKANMDLLERLRTEFSSTEMEPEKFMRQVKQISESMMALFTAGDPTSGVEKIGEDIDNIIRNIMIALPGESAGVALFDWLTKSFDDSVLATELVMKENIATMQQAFNDYISGGDVDENIVTQYEKMIDREIKKLQDLQATHKEATKTKKEGMEEDLSNFEKFSKGYKKFAKGVGKVTKDMAKFDSDLRSDVIDAGLSIAMVNADSKVDQLKIQKYMIAANVAKGVIDLWTDPAPTGPVAIAQAVAQSATLTAKGMSSIKTVDQQISAINAQKGTTGSTQTRFAQYGMNEVVSQATPIIAGEAGAELVQITPLEGANVDGPQGGGNIVITGNILSRDFVQGELIDEIREAIRQGYDFR